MSKEDFKVIQGGATKKEKTLDDIFENLTEGQKQILSYILVGLALTDSELTHDIFKD